MAKVARIVFNEAALQRLLLSPVGPVARDLLRRAINVESQAKRNATGRPGPNVQSGRLRASITHELVEEEGKLKARIGSNVEYALYVEEGTQPHLIQAGALTGRSSKKALHWPGAAHPVLSVHHPGSKAYPYLRPALEAARI